MLPGHTQPTTILRRSSAGGGNSHGSGSASASGSANRSGDGSPCALPNSDSGGNKKILSRPTASTSTPGQRSSSTSSSSSPRPPQFLSRPSPITRVSTTSSSSSFVSVCAPGAASPSPSAATSLSMSPPVILSRQTNVGNSTSSNSGTSTPAKPLAPVPPSGPVSAITTSPTTQKTILARKDRNELTGGETISSSSSASSGGPGSGSGSATVGQPRILLAKRPSGQQLQAGPYILPTESQNSDRGDDDDPWSKIGPQSSDANNLNGGDVLSANKKLWEQGNSASASGSGSATSSVMPLLPANAPPVPPQASLRILRRPSPGSTPGSSGSSSPANSSGAGKIKSLSERELEYNRARERIFAGEDFAAPSSAGTSNAGDSETESRAGSAAGEVRKGGTAAGGGRKNGKSREGSVTPPTNATGSGYGNGNGVAAAGSASGSGDTQRLTNQNQNHPRGGNLSSNANKSRRPARGEPTAFERLRPPQADLANVMGYRSSSRGPVPYNSPQVSPWAGSSQVVRQPMGPQDLAMGFNGLRTTDTYPYGGGPAQPGGGSGTMPFPVYAPYAPYGHSISAPPTSHPSSASTPIGMMPQHFPPLGAPIMANPNVNSSVWPPPQPPTYFPYGFQPNGGPPLQQGVPGPYQQPQLGSNVPNQQQPRNGRTWQ